MSFGLKIQQEDLWSTPESVHARKQGLLWAALPCCCATLFLISSPVSSSWRSKDHSCKAVMGRKRFEEEGNREGNKTWVSLCRWLEERLDIISERVDCCQELGILVSELWLCLQPEVTVGPGSELRCHYMCLLKGLQAPCRNKHSSPWREDGSVSPSESCTLNSTAYKV